MTTTPTPGATLTDRYLAAVTQHLPHDQAPDVTRELRATIEDTIEARVAEGADPAEAEREVLMEMGRPELLSAEYGGRSLWLIGPALYPDYVRLLRVLVPTLLAVLGVVWVIGLVVEGAGSVGEVVTSGLGLLWQAGVQLLFWVTVVFAVLERTRPEAERGRPLVEWTPDHLPEVSSGRQIGRVEGAFGVLFLGLLLLFVLDNLAGVSFGTDFVQLLDPEMSPAWKVGLVAVVAASVAVEVVKLVAGRWSMGLAVANAAVDLLFLGVVAVLWLRDELLNPGLDEALEDITEALGATADRAWWDTTVAITLGVFVVVTVWDLVDGFRKAARSDRGGC
jgi:hypothetical protein